MTSSQSLRLASHVSRNIACIAGPAIASACGGTIETTPPPVPKPGALNAVLVTPNANDGAVLFNIAGGPIDSITTGTARLIGDTGCSSWVPCRTDRCSRRHAARTRCRTSLATRSASRRARAPIALPSVINGKSDSARQSATSSSSRIVPELLGPGLGSSRGRRNRTADNSRSCPFSLGLTKGRHAWNAAKLFSGSRARCWVSWS